jgi:hypothetical protein
LPSARKKRSAKPLALDKEADSGSIVNIGSSYDMVLWHICTGQGITTRVSSKERGMRHKEPQDVLVKNHQTIWQTQRWVRWCCAGGTLVLKHTRLSGDMAGALTAASSWHHDPVMNISATGLSDNCRKYCWWLQWLVQLLWHVYIPPTVRATQSHPSRMIWDGVMSSTSLIDRQNYIYGTVTRNRTL